MKHASLAEHLATRAGHRSHAALARRMEAAWQQYESARASGGVAAALPFLRRWESLRQALACRLAGQPVAVVIPADPQPLAMPQRPACRTTPAAPIPDVLQRRFAAAWLAYSGHRQAGRADLATATLRRWWKLRAALENALPGTRTDTPAARRVVIRRTSRGGAQLSIPLPRGIRDEFAPAPRLHFLTRQIGERFGILADAFRDSAPDLRQIGRDGLLSTARGLAPLASFGRQPLEAMNFTLAPTAWRDYSAAATVSGIPADRLLAAAAVELWAECLDSPPGAAARSQDASAAARAGNLNAKGRTR